MRKIYIILMCLLFSLSVLLGCGKEEKKAEAHKTTAAATVTTTAKAANNGQNTAANVTANTNKITVSQTGTYSDKDHVAKYIYQFKKLPSNYITKGEAKKLGWQTKGTLDKVAPGKSIGGDRYGDYENKLPKANNRKWTECDIDYVKGNRNAKRIIFSNDGLIYYTNDHYKSFTKLDVK